MFNNLAGEINKFFKNYALEQFGTSILEYDESGGLKSIFEKTVDNQLKKNKLEPKNLKNSMLIEL